MRQRNLKPYVFLATGAAWLILAIVLRRADFVIAWQGKHVPVAALWLFRAWLPVLFFGWIAPVLFGSWLLCRK